MQSISLTVRLPEGLDPAQVADIAHVVADAAHRCTDWNDQATWDIVQTDGRVVTVTTPLALRGARITGRDTSGGQA